MNGELVVVDDVAQAFTARVVEAFRTRPHDEFRIALSGGETARACYEHLAEVAADEIDWWKVHVYWGDERAVPLDHPDANFRLASEALLERIGAVNMVYPMDCEQGADPYQLRLGELGGLDVIHLGLGTDGHTASLFPGSPALDADPGRLVAMNHDPSGANPYERMTLTYSGISRGRLVLVTVSGEDKCQALARVVAGDDVPAAHVDAPNLVWLADRPAAGDLEGRPTR